MQDQRDIETRRLPRPGVPRPAPAVQPATPPPEKSEPTLREVLALQHGDKPKRRASDRVAPAEAPSTPETPRCSCPCANCEETRRVAGMCVCTCTRCTGR